MENIILHKTRYLKAFLLTALVGFFAFKTSAQTWDATTVPPSPQYANQEATVTYEASGFPAGTTFILWDDVDNNNQIDPDETIFGTSTVQGAAEDIDFMWPENNFWLKLGGFSGDVVEGEIINIENFDVVVIGTNQDDYTYDFDRSSARSFTTTSYDLDTTDPVVLSISIGDFGLDVDNPLEVLYSTDDFATAGTVLTEDGSGLDEIDFGGVLDFTLPSGAKNPNTSFRIRQKGTIDYDQGKAWEVYFAEIEIGETYALEAPGLGVNQFTTILVPQLTINDILNTDNVSFGNIYPGDDITVEAELQEADFTNLDFAVTITNNDGQTYLLENQNVTADNVTKQISVVGDVPADIMYDNFNQWDVDIYAYEGAEILFGVSEFYNFSGGLPTDFEQVGGFQDGAGLTFDEAGERSVTTIPYNITNTDGVLTFYAARANNVLSPEGTDIIVEYSTDGETYNELTSIPLNSLTTGGTEIVLDTWPAGVVSNSTQFRFRQEANNGTDLDVFVIQVLDIQNNTNIVSEDLIGRGAATDQVNIFSPFITLDNINVGGDGQAFPMEDYTLTYTIDDGTFPTNTPATAYLQRTGQPDIIIGETNNVNGESIDITVPPIEAGDYDIYFTTLNDQEYGTVNLAVYDLGLEITEVEYNDPVLVGEDEFTYAGSAITVNYTIQGTPGAGAELMMSVYDNNPDVDDWVMIGSTTTLDGAITATLPLGVDYDNNPDVRLSLGSGGVYTEDFSEVFFDEYFYNDPFSTELIESSQGTGDNFRPDAFEGSGVRSATSVPIDLTYGGSLSNFDLWTENNFTGNFDVKLQGSTDGDTWIDLDEVTFNSISQTRTFNIDIPFELWSENFQFRIIYNEDEAFGSGENVVKFYDATVTRPAFLEVVQDDAAFNLIRPSLAVSDYDKTAFVMGEEVSINYNAVGFPAATEYAAVVEQGGEYYVAGTSADEGAATITAVMPIAFQNSLNNYDLTIVPFEPATAGGDYKQGETILIDNEEDFLTINGQDPAWETNFNIFDFDQIGDRELLTKAFDLSGTSEAILNFDFNNTFAYGSLDVNANKNTVPRLEISTDGGATFQVVPVYELEEGEEQIYDDGLLYLQQGYNVELPAEAYTEATHFRFSQPLNLGENANRWSVDNISLTLNDDNRVADFIFTDNVNGNNPETINITEPDLNGYEWMQADLDDAVFNGETFDYSWNLAEGLNSSDVDAFPAGTNFVFFLEEGGDYVMNPDTGMPYVLGTTTSLGTFEAEVPFFVVNGNYNVRIAAYIEIEGENGPEDYYFYGDEESGDIIGDLDVFLRVAELVYQGDENANIYAGQDVEFAIELENDETNNAATGDLFANLLLVTNEGDYLLAAQQGLGNITASLPTWFNGNADFKLQLTENEALGDVGTIINDSELENLEENVSNFTSELFSDFVEAEMVGNAQVVQTRKFSKEEFSSVIDVEWDYNFSDVIGNTNVMAQYSIDNGQNWVTLLSANYNNGFYNEVFSGQLGAGDRSNMESNGFILRWIQETPNGTFNVDDLDVNFGGQSFDEFNMEDYPANFTIGKATKSQIDFDGTSGRRFVTTRTFTVEELENTTAFGFDLSYDQLPGDLTTSQYLIFEYSTDGGATYTEMQQYPEMDADMTLNGDRFLYVVSTEMKENGVKFRWRQEENKGNITLDNLSFLFGETIPFDYIDANEFVNQQAFLITAIPSEACLADELTISYEIRGVLGENDFLKVMYSDAFGSSTTLQPEFIPDGTTGDLTFQLPSNAVEAGVNNKFLKFELEGNVESQTAGSFNQINGTETEESTEIVAPLNTEASFTVNDPLACESEDVIVELDNADLQDFFLYEIIDGEGTVLGSLTRDPEMPMNQINLGQISETTDLELRVTAQSSAGTVCNTLITDDETVEVLQNFELYSEITADLNPKLVAAGTELTTCDGAEDVTLSVRRLLENGSTTTGGADLVEWFRDDLNNLIASGPLSIDDDGDIEVSGAYFARVTTSSCVYTTESIQINVVETPDQPTVTVVSGDLAACSSADPVVLEAPEGFEYYLWSNGATTRTITVEDQGSYSVQVSNVPFGNGCSSPSSTSVDIDRYETPDFKVYSSTTSDFIGAGEVINVCSSTETIFFNEDGSYENNGIVQVIRDGVNYATVEQPDDFIVLTESGVYSFVWNFDAFNVAGCTASSVEFTLNLNDVADVTPTITVTGDLNSCDPDNEVTLEGPAGFENYVWSRGSTTLSVNSRTITVSESGSYTLEVSNTDLNSSCALSNESTPVVLNNVSSDDVFINIAGFGDAVSGQVYDICSNNSTSITVSGASGAVVTWFQDGAEYATSTNSNGSVNINKSGAYFAEVAFDGCVFTTPEVTFNVLEVPEDAPTITATGDLTFCDGEGSVILEGPEGFDYYEWLLNDIPLNINGVTNNNTIEVIQNGNYTLQVGSISADGAVRNCLSPVSNSITINSRGLPSLPDVDLFDNSCGEGPITFILTPVFSNVSYQLINAATDQPSGLPVVGNPGGSTFITSDVVSEETTFYIEATNSDGSGCTNSNPETATFTYAPNNVTLEVEGAQLIARYNYSGSGSIEAVRWYRNDVLLTNAGSTSAFSSQSSISITDAAEYRVEVEYTSGCVVTASSADLDGRVLSNRDAMDMLVTSYPNPAQSDITLNVNSQYMGKHEVIVTSMTGQIMMESSFEKSNFEAEHPMDINNLQKGIYNVQIRHDGLTQNVRIIKK